MISFFTQVGFLNPWALAALLTLPALWFILRVIPPAPKKIIFAPFRFLLGLNANSKVTSHTPWWILALRLLIISLVIVAFARPVFHLSKEPLNDAPLLLVIENGWSAAANWQDIQSHGAGAIRKAARSGQNIYLLKTAYSAGEQEQLSLRGPLAEGQALAELSAIAPQPWPSDFKAAASALEKAKPPISPDILWIGTGGFTSSPTPLIKALEKIGSRLAYLSCAPENCALLLSQSERAGEYIIEQPFSLAAQRDVQIDFLAANGRALYTHRAKILNKRTYISTDIPPEIFSKISRLQINGAKTAGSVFLLPGDAGKKTVGLITDKALEETKPYIDGIFYLQRALSPYAEITADHISTLLETENKADILIAQGAIETSEEISGALENWINGGGVLLRFAGETLQQNPDDAFLPVPLRYGQRALDGALTWDKPRNLSGFESDTPLEDLSPSETITVKRQILADPAFSLTGKVWATLEDGTPLITAERRGSGWLILIHTSAAPGWSNLPLTGLYVEILRKIIALSNLQNTRPGADGKYILTQSLSAKGELISPKQKIELTRKAFEQDASGPQSPPGYYTLGGASWPRSLGEHIDFTGNADDLLPASFEKKNFSGQIEKDLTVLFVAAAFALFLLDWFILIAISLPHGALPFKFKTNIAALLLAFGLGLPLSAHASEQDIKYASSLHLAYFKSGDAAIDNISKRGLENLARALSERTSIEPGGVAALDPARDTLSFFPFIYWPVGENVPDLNDKALQNINSYLAHGGTLLIDLRDGRAQFSLSDKGRNFGKLAQRLSFPALTPIGKDHVLNKSFYLLEDYPGHYLSAPLWVASNEGLSNDGVSGILLGGNDWARAWANLRESSAINPILTGLSRQDEMALRFSINVTMYTLTGTYKADQVHIPHILKRLGE